MEAKDFFFKLLNAPIEYIAIENPTPLKVVELPGQDQAIQPYEYEIGRASCRERVCLYV